MMPWASPCADAFRIAFCSDSCEDVAEARSNFGSFVWEARHAAMDERGFRWIARTDGMGMKWSSKHCKASFEKLSVCGGVLWD